MVAICDSPIYQPVMAPALGPMKYGRTSTVNHAHIFPDIIWLLQVATGNSWKLKSSKPWSSTRKRLISSGHFAKTFAVFRSNDEHLPKTRSNQHVPLRKISREHLFGRLKGSFICQWNGQLVLFAVLLLVSTRLYRPSCANKWRRAIPTPEPRSLVPDFRYIVQFTLRCQKNVTEIVRTLLIRAFLSFLWSSKRCIQ